MNFKNIYNNLDSFPIDNYHDFFDSIEKSYKDICQRTYQINTNNCPSIDLKDLESINLHDCFSIIKNGIKFDCLMTPIPPKPKSLFIIFSGTRNPTDYLPVFKRWSYYKFIDAIVLNIADPMFLEYKDLSLGWYYGNKDESYIEYLSEIIKKIQSLLNISNNHIFFFGSSGGGYVALQLSLYFNNTNHIVINPQILISKYHYAETFSKITGIDLNAKDIYKRNETDEIIAEKIAKNLNKYVIVQNLTDEHDCTSHFFPMLRKIDIDRLHLGLNCFNSIYIYGCTVV